MLPNILVECCRKYQPTGAWQSLVKQQCHKVSPFIGTVIALRWTGVKAAGGLPTLAVDANQLRKGVQLADLMVATGLAPSKGHARRLVRSGGARGNDTVVTDETARLTDKDTRNGVIKLSTGRKRHALIRLV